MLDHCREKHLPLICAGKVLALMDMMDAQQCTMNHLHDISKVGYATIYNYLALESLPRMPTIERLVMALGYEDLDYSWLAHWNVKGRLGM